MINIKNINNLDFEDSQKYNLIYCDYIYQNTNFEWIDKYWNFLSNDSIFIAQTDDSTVAECKIKLNSMPNSFFINTCISIQEWGGVPRKGFPKKHDYIHIFSNGKNFKWYGNRIQIQKITRQTAFDKKGTGLKTPCSVFYDIGNFSTMSKERIKIEDGKNIRWQKSMALLNRLCLPFTDEEDYILDPFMGSGSLGKWCKQNNRNYMGLEIDPNIFAIAKRELL